MVSIKDLFLPGGERTRVFQMSITVIYLINELGGVEGDITTADLVTIGLNTLMVMFVTGWFGRYSLGVWKVAGTWREPYLKRTWRRAKESAD